MKHYKCPYPGCRKTRDKPGACQHGAAQVTMQQSRAVPSSRLVDTRYQGRSTKQYSE